MSLATSCQAQFEGNGFFFRTEFITKLGLDYRAAALLSQILYWYSPGNSGGSKLRVNKEGKYWIAKSAKEWLDEVGLNSYQLSQALKILVSKGFIEIAKYKFSGAPTTHIRVLNAKGNQFFHNVKDFISTLLGKSDFVTVAKSITETTTTISLSKDKDIKKIAKPSASQVPPKKPYKDSQPEKINKPSLIKKVYTSGKEFVMKIDKVATAKEVLAQVLKNKGKIAHTAKPGTVGRLEELWKEGVLASGKPFVGSWTLKQKGQAKRLYTVWEGDAEKILKFILKDWVGYVIYVEQNTTAFKLPIIPNLGLMVKFANEARCFYMETMFPQKQVFEKPVKKPVQSIAESGVQVVVQEKEVPMTMEELLDSLKGLGIDPIISGGKEV